MENPLKVLQEKEVQKQLRENIEVIDLPLPKGSIEIKIVAYDSNNNPEHHYLVDGFWLPFKVIGLVRWESEDVTLAFMATMDYESGIWKLNRLDTELLYELAQKSSLFKEAYQKLVGKDFNGVKEVNPEFIEFLKGALRFQQTLSRICSRWTTH